MPKQHRDPLETFSHRLAQVKLVIVEIVIFIGFLLFVWQYVSHEFKQVNTPQPAQQHEVQQAGVP